LNVFIRDLFLSVFSSFTVGEHQNYLSACATMIDLILLIHCRNLHEFEFMTPSIYHGQKRMRLNDNFPWRLIRHAGIVMRAPLL